MENTQIDYYIRETKEGIRVLKIDYRDDCLYGFYPEAHGWAIMSQNWKNRFIRNAHERNIPWADVLPTMSKKHTGPQGELDNLLETLEIIENIH
jgi:hypothetical protein